MQLYIFIKQQIWKKLENFYYYNQGIELLQGESNIEQQKFFEFSDDFNMNYQESSSNIQYQMGAKPITIQQSQIKTDKTSFEQDRNSQPQKNDRMPYKPIKPIILEKPLQVLPEEELPLLLMMASFEQFILDENKTKNRKLIRQQFLLDMRKVKHRSHQKSQLSYDSDNKSNFTSLQYIRSRKLPMRSILKPTTRSITQFSKNKHVSFEYRRINTERQFY